jgi:two-component system chemotaxis response regulator CheB
VPKIRILVVDDSVVLRRLLTDTFAGDPALEVVGTAANGRLALAKLPQLNPDVVTLDIEMPEMDGLATLKELRKQYPRLPVIMFSALTERGAAATLEALALGATDYFTKPTGEGGLEASVEVLRAQLIPAIKALCLRQTGVPSANSRADKMGVKPAAPRRPQAAAGPVQVVAIGASTGGPNALAEIFTHLPATFPVPIVMVQHMPPMFTRLLAERLSSQSPIPVREGLSGGQLRPGQAWIAPGDHHMIVVRDGTQHRLLIHEDPPENSCRPAVDVLFRSVAKTFGGNSLAVILTGMGQDGLRGCELLREAGAQILAQDEATSVVWGMPGFVARAGLADRVLPLSIIPNEILHRVQGTPPA